MARRLKGWIRAQSACELRLDIEISSHPRAHEWPREAALHHQRVGEPLDALTAIGFNDLMTNMLLPRAWLLL